MAGPLSGGSAHRAGDRLVEAVTVMAGFLVVIWVLQLVDVATHYSLLRFGIVPRNPGKLEDILSAPFLHASWAHIEANTPPLLVLGVFVALRGVAKMLAVTATVIVVSGFGVWLLASSGSVTVGASGVIFGYLGYLLARGLVERRPLDLLVAVAVGAMYWWALPALLPGAAGVSWQGHLFGFLGGILSAWLFRSRRVASAAAPGQLTGGTAAEGGGDLFSLPATANGPGAGGAAR